MILEDKLTPVGNLSAVFLTATNALDLQFAYFESSLVVEFLVNRYGLEALKKVLQDLGQGREVNQALEAHLAPLPQIDQGFQAFALESAQKLAPSLDWRKPAPAILADPHSEAFENWARLHPHNYWALTVQARNLVNARQFKAAQGPLNLLIEAYPEDSSPENAYRMLAEAYRGLNETQLEQQTLAKLATLDSDAMDVYLRLIELAAAAKDWPEVLRNTDRCLAVNPLVAPPHRFQALAHESLGQRDEAVESYRLVLRLDPTDPAEVHYRLARLLRQKDDPAAKREVLQALEEAPRYRDALRLLLEIEGRAGARARQP
jgi:tetratricopeptide (TPR) repeat protein